MIEPISPFRKPTAPTWAGGSPTTPHEPQDEVDLLRYRILMAHINHDLQRGAAPPAEETPEPPPRSTTGMIQDAQTDMGVGDVKGPLTAAELWGDYLMPPKHNPWR